MRAMLTLSAIPLVLCACGGGGSSAPSPQPIANQSPGGIWSTQYVVTSGPNTGDTIDAIALVSETGEFYTASINTANNCAGVGFGQATVTGNNVTATENAAVVTYALSPAVNTSCTFPDGSTSATGNLTGTVTQRTSFTLSGTATTSAGTQSTLQPVTFAFNALYDEAPSYAKLTGSYTTAGGTLSINAAGAINEIDSSTGCTLSGQAFIPNASFNLYALLVTFSGCSSSYSGLNGLTLSGLATLNDTINPNRLIFGASAAGNGRYVVIASELPKQ